MDPVQRAFFKIKEEINSLKEELIIVSKRISHLESRQNYVNLDVNTLLPTNNPTQNPTVPQEMKGSQMSFFSSSTGNEGVPTDIYTNNLTDTQPSNNVILDNNFFQDKNIYLQDNQMKSILDSLDSIRKEIRLKLKRLTAKEMLVFTMIYSLQNKGIEDIGYKTIANNLNLTESSIRDYVNRLISKGIPVQKGRINNKIITLNISQEFQRVASLQTVIQLRDL